MGGRDEESGKSGWNTERRTGIRVSKGGGRGFWQNAWNGWGGAPKQRKRKKNLGREAKRNKVPRVPREGGTGEKTNQRRHTKLRFSRMEGLNVSKKKKNQVKKNIKKEKKKGQNFGHVGRTIRGWK